MRKPFKLSIDEVFNALPETITPGHRATFHGVEVPTDIINLYVYKQSGCDCKACKAKGSHFYIEKFGEGPTIYNQWHLNLYAINEYGHEVMITKDHILAKSAGGSDELINLQPMCKRCNQKKGCKPMAVLVQHLQTIKHNSEVKERKAEAADHIYSYKDKTIKRLKERYDLDVTAEEYKSLSKIVAKKGFILCDLSSNKTIRSISYKGKEINFIYNADLGMLETAIESEYDKVRFKYLPAYMTEEFAVREYTQLLNAVNTDFKIFETDKETAIYFNTKPHSQILFCKWKKPQHIERALWRHVNEKFKDLHRVKENA